MRPLKYIVILFIFGICLACSQKIHKETMDNSYNTYATFWDKIDTYEQQGKVKTALQNIQAKLSEFEESGLESQILRAKFYEAKYQARLTENSSEQLIRSFETRLSDLKDSKYKHIYNSILGELYDKYARRNQYKIAQRTHTISDSIDIATWSMKELLKKSNDHYVASVESLKDNKNFHAINSILNKPKNKPKGFDLNTLLIIRAIQHFSNEFTLATEHTNDFILKSDEAFANKETFINIKFDDLSNQIKNSKLRTLQLYQQLLKYHDEGLLSDRIDHDRLRYVYRISQSENKHEFYQERLTELSKTSHYAKYYLAAFLVNRQNSDLNQVRDLLLEVKSSSIDSSIVYNATDLLANLVRPHYDIKMEEVLLPSQPSLFLLNYKNIDTLRLSIKSISNAEFQQYTQNRNREDQLNILENLKVIKTWSINLPDGEYRQLSTESIIPKLPLGHYVLLSNHSDQIAANFFQVSNIAAHTLATPNGNFIQVYHRETGEAYPNVNIDIIEEKYNRNAYEESIIKTLKSNSTGESKYSPSGRKRTKLRLSIGDDIYNTVSQYTNDRVNSNEQSAIHIFTDRNLYRPGNRLQGKAIPVSFDKKTKSNRLYFNEKLTLTVRDPNYQEIHTAELVTNEFGSVTFDFKIDEDRLSGSYSIELKNKSNQLRGNQQFQVEEYKRPSFTTEIKIPSKAFKLGDTINVETHAELFSGAPLSNANIEYRVTRIANRYVYRSYMPQSEPDAEIIYGQISTDNSGKANFTLPLIAPMQQGASYTFDIQLSIADITGETQFVSKSINVNQSGFTIDLNLPNVLSNEQLKAIPINAINSVGEKIETDVDIELVELNIPEFWKKNKYWESLDTMILTAQDYASMPFEYTFNDSNQNTWEELDKIYSNKSTLNVESELDLPELESGFYILKIKHKNKLVTERKFQVINFSNRVNLSPQLISYRINKPVYEVGDELSIDISIPQPEVSVQYLIEKNGEIAIRKWLPTNSHQIKDKITASDIGGYTIHLRSVFRNRIEYKKITIEVPYTSAKLDYTIDQFKSNLLPSEEVSWKVNFKDNNNRGLITESVWAMYDISLDDLYSQHEWRPFILPNNMSKVSPIYTSFRSDHSITLKQPKNSRPTTPRPDNSYPNINTYGFSMMERIMMQKSARASAPMAEASLDSSSSNERREMSLSDESVDQDNAEIKNTTAPRKNFNETVFFFPNIESTADGNATVSFEMNDAMTSWKVLIFAHDKEGRFLYDTLQLKSSQDVFILANKPRFSRLKDNIWMTTKLVNNSNEDISATTWIEFFDITTGENITNQISINQKEKQINLLRGSSVSVDWKLSFPENLESRPIGFRTGVKHDNGSDIIEDFLQVLDDSQLVKESEALFLKAGETMNYSLDSLGTGNNQTIHLELMTDLDWQIIQSLPYLDTKSFETCSNYLYQFIANSIGNSIVRNNMYVKNQLQDEKEISNQLNSKKEFKTIDLQQTPWVRDANNEQAQRELMLKYLDTDAVNKDLKKSLEKLISFQQYDGGFSWLKDRPSSLFISSSVLQAIGRLNEKGIQHVFGKEELEKLIGYIDNQILENLNKAQQKDIVLDLFHYIHARSYFHNNYPLTSKLVQNFEKEYSKDWIEYSTSTQATIGAIAYRLNNKELSESILVSIKEQAIESESLGTYWKTNRNYFSNQSSIDRHVAVMEFLEHMEEESNMLENAKIWLMNNKRTNAWKNKASTSSAVFAFLKNKQTQDIPNSLEMIAVSLADKPIAHNASYSSKGTQATVALDSEPNKTNSNIAITNNNQGPVWAAIYKTYRKPIREIESYKTDAINIQKSIFVKQLTDNGPVLSQIESAKLKPGDVITVRVTINNDRALQFVHIEDKRASGLEPKDVISKYKYTDALFYYQVTKDESTHFLINDLPRGTHILEYDLTVNLRGEYSSGFSSIQCQYAPEFGAHSKSINLEIPK